jgi:ABC-type glutathione transport system ATPase component
VDDLLTVTNLTVEFIAAGRRRKFRAVDDVSFSVARGETVALVGESGSGKSTIGRAVLGLTPSTSGSIRFDGKDITRRDRATQVSLARELQVVFQDPYSSLNPSKTIGESLTEPLRAQGGFTRLQARERITGLLERVGLPSDSSSRYPSRFSGGQRQRIAIARALALNPRLVICDEPTSALDVSTQAQVLELLSELKTEFGLAYLFITHDLAVVRDFADRVLVLRQGAIVETGTATEICDYPKQTYTQKLVAAAPVPDPQLQRQRRELRLAMAIRTSEELQAH